MALAGAAFAIMAASPAAVSEAYDNRPPQHMEQMMPPAGSAKLGFSHRLQAMVADGKITKDQAFKLQHELDKFHQKQQKDREHFMEKLPDKTGISESTLKEIMTPPHPMRAEQRHDERHD